MSEPDADSYALKSAQMAEVPAPDLPYQPPTPRKPPPIALIGAGGIAGAHLDAYRTAGWPVVAIANRSLPRAQSRAAEFFPEARTTTDVQRILDDPTIKVLDITPHPANRLPLIEAALKAGKHVLSQKPFTENLDDAERLIALARANDVHLAVNHNGRWAPHLAWMREAVLSGQIGTLTSAHVQIAWDHSWIEGTPFEQIPDLVLYDFAIHWFDFLTTLAPGRLQSVTATSARAAGQTVKTPLLSQALVTLKGGQASFTFDGATAHGPRDTTLLTGTEGTLHSTGPGLGRQSVTLTTAAGRATPSLTGTWFNDGFRGAMGELLCAIEQNRPPANAAETTLPTLALTFAACASARQNRPVEIGTIRALPKH
ncbi:Gfo/Idh/MocA family protein [Vannielia litorea]|uniref:Gfo/Idh/MocA family protein n=1 Tax=Vannielia litorea TaxID=1217970 RepID=UPI001C97B285|nr:Gfo/Idh/MocA family oxidoreductase [Vannielia litorea]MBY6046930.1 Gfo/Idh/MocA family oxidoreductase [Vannielia litorea]MBY6074344.1 Gfo/Idh/MocA family oxidoreductase [Vannielia litorea]